MTNSPDGTTVEVEISVAEEVYVSIKTNRESYDRVLKDAKKIAKNLKEQLCATCKLRERTSGRSYG